MSFAAKVEKLMFTIGLTDKTAGPVGAINARIDKLANNAQKGFRNIAYGTAGITGAVYLLNRAMAPAIEQQRALNEVSSLDVEPKALAKLNRMALLTQAQFGTASADIIRSAYEIQSSMAGISGDQLTNITRASAILAKGTKADATVITDYMGTLYNIFEDSAKNMGVDKWVEKVAGQTATAVQMYKTTGTKMQQAFSNLGAGATEKGIPFAEQLAILGTLQGTVQGGESGTLFTGYLTGLGAAEKKLGVALTRVNGKALPINVAIDNIMKKFGHLGSVARFDLIKSAFGSDTAAKFIDLMAKKTNKLGKEVANISDIQSMEKAIKMAKAMTDPWQQLSGTISSIHTAFSQALMPSLQPMIDKMTEAGATVLKWTEKYPYLTRAIALTGLFIISLIGTIAALTVMVGIYRFMAVGWAVVQMVLTGGMWLLTTAVSALTWAYRLARTSLLAFYLLSMVSGGALAALRVIMLALATSVWTFTAALLANPMTWIVIAVIAVIAALGYGIYKLVENWDVVKKAFFDGIEYIKQNFEFLDRFISNLNPFNVLGDQIDWIIEKLNLIPGIDIETRFGKSAPRASSVNPFTTPYIGPYALPDDARNLGRPTLNTQSGGIINQIRQSTTDNTNRGMYVERISIESKGNESPEELMQKFWLAAG
jgi:TP901 family phage tail tape measure protein